MQRTFTLERETKRTYRFKKVVPHGEEPLCGVIYIQKYVFKERPETITVKVGVER